MQTCECLMFDVGGGRDDDWVSWIVMWRDRDWDQMIRMRVFVFSCPFNVTCEQASKDSKQEERQLSWTKIMHLLEALYSECTREPRGWFPTGSPQIKIDYGSNRMSCLCATDGVCTVMMCHFLFACR
jgi:hypothetical protein